MTKSPENKLKKLKSSNLNKADVYLWIVNKKLQRDKTAKYRVLSVEINDKVSEKLKRIVKGNVDKSNHLQEYSYLTEDQDDRIFTISYKETDFFSIYSEISKGIDAPRAKEKEDLLNTSAYIVQIKDHNFEVLSFTPTDESWKPKKRTEKIPLLFKEKKLIDLEEESVFRIQKKIGFFYFEEIMFILNKKSVESGLNFREGMKTNRDLVLMDFETLRIVDNIEKLREEIGENTLYLRKISMIKNNGYYKDQNFMTGLIAANKTEDWGLQIVNNQIVVTDDNIKAILTVLNDDRLKSPITRKTFDVHVKKPLGKDIL